MVAALADPDLEEVRKMKHRRSSRVPSSGVAVDTGAIEIDPWVFRRKVLHTGDLVGDRIVSEIAVVSLVETLGARWRSHPVYADDNEAKLRQWLKVVPCRGKASAPA